MPIAVCFLCAKFCGRAKFCLRWIAALERHCANWRDPLAPKRPHGNAAGIELRSGVTVARRPHSLDLLELWRV